MLPAYNAHRYEFFFFFVFLVVGLFFFLNILLAIVFENYKAHIESKVKSKNTKRVKLILPYYKCYDREEKGYLTINEAKKFFGFVMDFDYNEKTNREAFMNIMKY